LESRTWTAWGEAATSTHCRRVVAPAAGWIPFSGFQLRKAGVQFDAVRVDGDTWPLSWYVPPTATDRFVHPLLPLNTAVLLLGDGSAVCQWGD
jgi:hypothetical protein